MANLKDTLVLGKLTATDSIIAKKFITDGSTNILLANGNNIAQTTFADADTVSGLTDSVTDLSNNKVSGPASSTNSAIALFDGTGGKTIKNSGVTIDSSNNISTSGSLKLSNNGDILWNSGSWFQRIKITDDSSDGTNVFEFQQSSNSGSSYTSLFTIKDNGTVVATTFNGALSGNASTSSYPLGFNSNGGNITWGTLSGDTTTTTGYRTIARWDSPNGGSVAFADGPMNDNTKKGQTSMQIDGYFYQNEGQYQVIDTNSGDSRYLKLAGGTMNGAINMNNAAISGVNTLSFADPGPNEGITWTGGNNWYIYESPNDLSTNDKGNLQFVQHGSRRMTIGTDGVVEIVGLLTITNNNNTVTIGSQNENWMHIYNSANIPFIFNRNVASTDGDLGTDGYPWKNIKFNGELQFFQGTTQKVKFKYNTTDKCIDVLF